MNRLSRDSDFPSALRSVDRAARVAALRDALSANGPLVLPGVVTALTALQAERAGFKACYLTGAGLANFEYALPDIGLMGLSDVTAQTRRAAAATSLPIIVDADTGYGGPLAVLRAVQELQVAGAAGVQIEDQEIPKRCGHFDGKRLVTTDEMVAKIHAAVTAREADTVIIARTDAVAVEGINAALERALAYHQAGADLLFVEGPRSLEELKQVANVLRGAQLMVNVVEGGRTPEMAASDLGALGYSVVLFANTVQRVMAKAAAEALEVISREGTTVTLSGAMLDWVSRQELVGLDLADRLEDGFRDLNRGSPSLAQPE
jgi:2,3-dimethylmalate lyase